MMNTVNPEITEEIVKEFLRNVSVSDVSYNTWVRPLRFAFEDDIMKVTIPQQIWHTRYMDLIEKSVPEAFETISRVVFYNTVEGQC